MQRVCEVAGYEVPTPFPRLTYAEAMRSYGIDKPDLRLPPFHPVEDLFPGANLTREGLPLVAIHIPKTGQAEPQGARRAEGVRAGARPARVRRRQATGARLSRADGEVARAHREPARTTC